MKKVWIIDPYNEIPEKGWREGRYYIIAKMLSENGYVVDFFISNFSHKEKKITDSKELIHVNPNFRIIVVPSIAYYNHISFKRIRYEKLFAKNINRNEHNLPLPDVVILKDPAIFMFNEIEPLIKRANAKLIVDIMDLWPELFEIKLPKNLRWLGKLIFYPFYLQREKIFKSASAITAVTADYLNIGIKINDKIPSRVVYWGCDTKAINTLVNSKNDISLNEFNLPEKKADIWGIYAGTLGENYDILTLLKASTLAKQRFPDLKILIAGSGPMEGLVKECAKKNNNIFYLGSLPTEQLYKLFGYCDFGFSTYSDASTVSMPIKSFDYLAAGLPLVNSLNRNLGSLVKDYKIGYQYCASNFKSLLEALTMLMSEREGLIAMKDRCKNLSKNFDNSTQYSQYVSLLKELTS